MLPEIRPVAAMLRKEDAYIYNKETTGEGMRPPRHELNNREKREIEIMYKLWGSPEIEALSDDEWYEYLEEHAGPVGNKKPPKQKREVKNERH